MKIPTLTTIILTLNFTACTNNSQTGYCETCANITSTGANNTSTESPINKTARTCSKAANLNYEYYKKCMKQHGYNLYSSLDSEQNSSAFEPPIYSDNGVSAPSAQGLEKVQLEKRGSSYYVPVRINDTITIPFVLDTGAGDLAIPEDVARTLIRAGALQSSDLIGKRSYQIANGSEEVSPVVRIREVRVGEHVVRNVTAGITPPNGEPLLGQSFLSKFGAIIVDYKRLILVLSP
jgi:clan AA aspartic protease (TIGR02281 family)